MGARAGASWSHWEKWGLACRAVEGFCAEEGQGCIRALKRHLLHVEGGLLGAGAELERSGWTAVDRPGWAEV